MLCFASFKNSLKVNKSQIHSRASSGIVTSGKIAIVRFPELYYSLVPVRTNLVAIKMPKYRPWRDSIDRDILRLITHGIDNKINSQDLPQVKRPHPTLLPINLEQLTTLFYLYAIGIVLAFIAFAGEKMSFKRCMIKVAD